MSEFDFLEEQGVSAALIKAAEEFRQEYGVSEEAKHRRIKPALPFYGKETLEMAMAAVLEQENLLLAGPKATGKNVLAENLAYIFGRPVYNVSFHVNTNSGDLIGTDTFVDNQVKLRKGSIYQCAEEGGFGILDEINMAKNDAVSVLHATLDYRRSIDVPGYDKIDLHPAARFIGTMNYGYAGTKELNEALVSRFLVIDMPAQNEETLGFIFNRMFPDAKKEAVEQFMGVFLDLQQKSMNSEISTSVNPPSQQVHSQIAQLICCRRHSLIFLIQYVLAGFPLHLPDPRALFTDPFSDGFFNTELRNKGKRSFIRAHEDFLHQIHSQKIFIEEFRQCALLNSIIQCNIL